MSHAPNFIQPAHYRPSTGGHYDEAHNGQQLRAHWASLFSHFDQDDGDSLPRLIANINRLRAEQAMSTASDERPWQLDPLPLMISAEEWDTLERGIIQRCNLLSALIEDFYGPATALRSGLLPPALAFANPSYLLPACGMTFEQGPLSLVAFDLGRAADGRWWVLNHRTEAPTGLGYVLENRIVLARALPEAIAQQNVERIAGFFRRYSEHLQRKDSIEATDDALTVILSNGPLSRRYPEHAYLGRYLGLPVVEGHDLSIRQGAAYLKTLEGLKPIRAVMRQIASEHCDPLQLRSDSLYGAPGLLDCARRGNVIIGNAIGTGVVENDAIMGFLPGLSERLLGEPLELASIATWWCGQSDALQTVLENIETLSLRSAFHSRRLLSSSVADYLQGDFDPTSQQNLASALRNAPYQFVGRDNLQLSQVPFVDPQHGIRSAPMTLRLYAAQTNDGFAVLPGGLARVATPQGDISKDVWIVKGEGRVSLPLPDAPTTTRRSDKNLPSRTADDLFWLGRYLERTEGAVRLYRALFRALSGNDSLSDEAVSVEQITDLLVILGILSPQKAQATLADGLQGLDRELWHLLFDGDSVDGLPNLLANVGRTAHRVRARQSTDTWRIFESLQKVPDLPWHTHSRTDVIALLADVIEKLSALAGKSAENMTRGYGWRLMELGKRIERARFTARLIRELCTGGADSSSGALTLLLDVTDSTITHRSRYRGEPSLLTVIDLLLVDGSNPRSVMYQIGAMTPHMQVMPMEPKGDALSDSQRILLTTQNELTLADIHRLVHKLNRDGHRAQLERLLKRSEQAMVKLSALISQTYFAHTRDAQPDIGQRGKRRPDRGLLDS